MYLDVVASSVDVEVLAADDSAELLSTTFSTGGFALVAGGGRPFGRTGGLVFPPMRTAAAAVDAGLVFDVDVVLFVFFVLTESLSVSSSSDASEASSSSLSVELSGENMLFFLLASVAALSLADLFALALSVGGALDEEAFDNADVVCGGAAADFVVGGAAAAGGGFVLATGGLALMFPLPALLAFDLASPCNCCCC